MSSDGCWRCGVSGHHRRDCTAYVDQGSAALTHADSRQDHRFKKRKTAAEVKKWEDWQNLKTAVPPPRCTLKNFVEKSLDYLKEKQDDLDDIGHPSLRGVIVQLEKAEEIKSDLRAKFPEFREIVLLTKNYFSACKSFDAEEELFRDKLTDLDKGRQALMSKTSKFIADMKEVVRQKSKIKPQYKAMVDEIQIAEGVLGERSPPWDDLEDVEGRIQALMIQFVEISHCADTLDKLCETNYSSAKVQALEARMVQIQERRKEMMRSTLNAFKLKTDLLLCCNCTDVKKQFAMPCGHQFCGSCLAQLKRCPYCSVVWGEAAPLRLN